MVGYARTVRDLVSPYFRTTGSPRVSSARNVDMVYDKAGNRITLTYPQGKNVAYTYDGNNRVSRILDGANGKCHRSLENRPPRVSSK